MGTGVYRCTGISLSVVVALLGAAVTVLLYYAGQDGLDMFYKDNIYMDEHRRIHKRMPTDDWYGVLVLRGWAFGFIFVVPGLIGITASLVFVKSLMIVNFIVGVVALVAGSFMYTAGIYTLVLYRVFVVEGIILKYDTWPWDCKYIRDDDDLYQEHVDETCETGRRASIYVIAAAAVSLIAWVFLQSNLLYCAYAFGHIGKAATAPNPDQDRPPRRFRHRRRRTTPPSESTLTTDTHANGATIEDETSTTQIERVTAPSTSQESTSVTQQEESLQAGGAAGLEMTVQPESVNDVTVHTDRETAPENINVDVGDVGDVHVDNSVRL